jgi:uncharacterized protein (TIGR00369 family)
MTDVDDLQAMLAEVTAPYVQALGLRVLEAGDDVVTLLLPVTPALVHGGGVVCGQAIMAAADTAMVAVMSAALGGFRPMTTVQLQTSFLRPVPGDAREVRVVARLQRRGRSISFGEVEVFGPDGRIAAHATTTYALL